MSDLATKSKTELATGLARAKATMARVREEGKAITDRTLGAGLTAGAGYATGAARKKWGTGAKKSLFVPGTEIEADLALGAVATLAGIAGIGGADNSRHLVSAGSGVLAAYGAISAFTA